MPEDKSVQQAILQPDKITSEPEIFVMPLLGSPKAPLKSKKRIPLSVILGVGGGALVLVLGGLAFWVLRPAKPAVITQKPNQASPERVKRVEGPEPSILAPLSPDTSTTTPEILPPAPVVPPKVLSFGPDDDSDGLTNLEEQLIYKSDPLRPDTDSDGFLDGNEVFHLYSPIAPTPVKLLGSGLIQQYDNLEFKYSFFYPSDWKIEQATSTTTHEILSRAPSGEFIGLALSDNQKNLALFDWYSREAPNSDITTLEPITIKGGYLALQTANRLTTYVALQGKVLIVNLNIGDKTQIEYRRTYEMVLNSLSD